MEPYTIQPYNKLRARYKLTIYCCRAEHNYETATSISESLQSGVVVSRLSIYRLSYYVSRGRSRASS